MPVATTLGYFIGDSQLKKRIGDHVGLKSCPKAVTRSDLLDAAVRLRLIGETDVAVKAPKKDGRRPRTWSQHVAATVRRPVPLSSDPVRYFTDAELKAAIEQQVGGGQVAPDRLSRATMVTEALTMGIITQRQADLPSPCQLTEDELVQLWKGHVEAQSDGAKKSKRPSGRGKLTEALLGLGLISTAQAEATRKRPDRAAAAQLSKDSHQSTRCASLSSMLRGLPNAAAMAATMRAASDDASRLFHQRSFLLWLHLHRLARNGGDLPDMDEDDELIEQAIEVIRQTKRASTSGVQRRLKIGYTRAPRIMDILEERGLVGPAQGSDPREILIDLEGEIPHNRDDELT
jgi:DNA segregation ATPase FtsK/SpoIIIE-like protein